MSAFNESKVKRQSAGTSAGGQFANKERPANDGVGLGSPVQAFPREPAHVEIVSRKIDKREARKRWNRGLGVAMATDRTFFNHSPLVASSGYVTRSDMVSQYGRQWADFDYMVSQSADSRNGAISFAAPDLGGGHALVSRKSVPIGDVRPGDRIDVGAVGNWKVRRQTRGESGELLFTMDGTLGDDDGPTLRVRQNNGAYTGELLDLEGNAYSDVSSSVASGEVVRHVAESDVTLVRERIARKFPAAVFTQPMVVDRSFENLSEHIKTYDCAPGGYGFVDGAIVKFNSFDDPRRLETVAVWEPNTTASSMVKRR